MFVAKLILVSDGGKNNVAATHLAARRKARATRPIGLRFNLHAGSVLGIHQFDSAGQALEGINMRGERNEAELRVSYSFILEYYIPSDCFLCRT